MNYPTTTSAQPILIEPVIHYPQRAACSCVYMMTVDVRLADGSGEWPYEEEEYTIYCTPDTYPLFRCEALGEPAVTLHRFGGTYGPITFLLTAAQQPIEGSLALRFTNGRGVPITSVVLRNVHIETETNDHDVPPTTVEPARARKARGSARPAREGPTADREPALNVRAVEQGMISLVAMMRSDAVRAAMSSFKADIEATRVQIILMADLMEMHDTLHRLQVMCYDLLVHEETRFPDETAVENLLSVDRDLQDIMARCAEIAGRPSLRRQNTSWVKDLSQAHTDLHQARVTKDRDQLGRARQTLYRILSSEPSRINARVVRSVKALRLDSLERAMTTAQESLNGQDLDSAQISGFSNSIRDLHSLNQILRTLADLHDHGQRLDYELRLLDAAPTLDFELLQLHWPEIKRHAESLYAGIAVGNANEWAHVLEADTRQLQTDIDNRAADRLQESYHRFRRSANYSFYLIGRSLNALCGELRVVSDSLSTVLEILPAAGSDQVKPGYLSVPQIAQLYNFPTGFDGSGQTIGLIELGGAYQDSDLITYFTRLGLPVPKVSWVSVDGAQNQSGTDRTHLNAEVTLGIEIIGSVAPAAHIVVYFAPNTSQGFLNAVNTAISDTINSPSVIAITWGMTESTWTHTVMEAMNQAFQKAAVQNITVVAAAGDRGVTDGGADKQPRVIFPASSPWVLACGATHITTEPANGSEIIVSESVWNTGSGATGGGVSDIFALPTWQSGVSVPNLGRGGTGRGIPDVAAHGAPEAGYQIYVNGTDLILGGTGAASALWTGLIALINQGVGRNVGYMNPVLYSTIGPQGALRNITLGNNGIDGVEGYSAGAGWNACTGWGSPDGQKLLNAFRVVPEFLETPK